MRAVIQRVTNASVEVNGRIKGKIKAGFLILLGVTHNDTEEDIKWLSRKIGGLRVFNDAEGMMNKNISDVGGQLLVVSQFTLFAKTKKGNRPSYIDAAKPEQAEALYQEFVKQLFLDTHIEIETGEFGAHMNISLINDGPVTIIIDTKQRDF